MWMKGEGYTARTKFPSAVPRFTHKKKGTYYVDIYRTGNSISK